MLYSPHVRFDADFRHAYHILLQEVVPAVRSRLAPLLRDRGGLAPSAQAATRMNGIDVFAQLTQHIKRQADTDKQAFAVAIMHDLVLPPAAAQTGPARRAAHCLERTLASGHRRITRGRCRRLPHQYRGIDAVRTDFQRTQAFLSLHSDVLRICPRRGRGRQF